MHCYVRYVEVKKHPYSLPLPKKRVFDKDAPVWASTVDSFTVTGDMVLSQKPRIPNIENTSQLISIDLIDTNGLSWNLITLCTEQKARSANIEAGRAWASKSRNKFQALTSLQLGRHTGTKTLFGPFTLTEACRDLQEGKGGHCDLFNVLICLSSLSWPHYCPSPKANTRKHWPAGPQYWFIRWSPVVVKSLSQHTQDIINSDLSVCACVPLCTQNVFMHPFQSFKANGVNKGNQGAGSRNLGRGSLSKKFGHWGQLEG